MKTNVAIISIGVLATAFSIGAVAQTSTSQTSTATTDRPTGIGVSQQTADEANRKAIQSGNTATVVRTGPTAGDKADQAASKTKATAKAAKNKVKDKAADATTDR